MIEKLRVFLFEVVEPDEDEATTIPNCASDESLMHMLVEIRCNRHRKNELQDQKNEPPQNDIKLPDYICGHLSSLQ
ncbi:hypothetical protein BVRB_9g213580 [Beta vulgaris subsp. vulgaris]|nr:hypothetical protein BVRB_9g213580 [Beta vulgaris subsp. vulgaris]